MSTSSKPGQTGRNHLVNDKHPRKRSKEPSKGWSAVLHVIGLSSFAVQYKYLIDNPNPISSGYGWHFQYLTIIGLSLCTLTFLTGLTSDLTTSTLSRLTFKLKLVLSTCSLPLSLLIATLYWSLRAIDPALVTPPDLELPLITDLGFHFFPFVFLFIDLLFFSPRWTVSLFPESMALSLAIAFGYWFWVEHCYSKNGVYPYPLFGLLSTAQRVALFGGSAAGMVACTAVLAGVYRRVNGVSR